MTIHIIEETVADIHEPCKPIYWNYQGYGKYVIALLAYTRLLQMVDELNIN